MFKCPQCSTEIDKVIVESICSQSGYINGEGIIEDYGPVDMVGETKDIFCPACSKSIKEWVTS